MKRIRVKSSYSINSLARARSGECMNGISWQGALIITTSTILTGLFLYYILTRKKR